MPRNLLRNAHRAPHPYMPCAWRAFVAAPVRQAHSVALRHPSPAYPSSVSEPYHLSALLFYSWTRISYGLSRLSLTCTEPASLQASVLLSLSLPRAPRVFAVRALCYRLIALLALVILQTVCFPSCRYVFIGSAILTAILFRQLVPCHTLLTPGTPTITGAVARYPPSSTHRLLSVPPLPPLSRTLQSLHLPAADILATDFPCF